MMETLKKAEAAHKAQIEAWQKVSDTALIGSPEKKAAQDALIYHTGVLAEIRRDLWKETL
jgi:hypothetical protein